jgi:hypothetical protein
MASSPTDASTRVLAWYDPRAMSESNSVPPLSGFAPDANSGEDVLDVDRQAMPIATLIVGQSVMPPLCVGIFGAEGSGITFFLRRVAQHVEASIAARAAQAHTGDATAFCAALQINYNPWHYVGANQWLALAERILEALQSSTPTGINGDDRQERLWQIGTAGKLLRELESKHEAAGRVLAIEQEALARAEAQYAAAVRQHAKQQSQPPQTEVNDSFASRADEDGSAEAIDRAGARLGLRQLSRNAAGLRKVLAQANTPMGRASLLTSTLTTQKYIGSVFLLFLVILLVGAAAWVLFSLYSEMRDVSRWVETVENALGALATVGTFFVLVVALLLGNRVLSAADALRAITQRSPDPAMSQR